jgi:hypothetical protein
MMERQTEIEIFIRDCPKARLLVWIENLIGTLGTPNSVGESTTYPSPVGTVVVTPNVDGGPFQSVKFNTADTPWSTDVDCARQAAKVLGCVVRCVPGQHYPKVNSTTGTFLEIEGQAEKLMHWERGSVSEA